MGLAVPSRARHPRAPRRVRGDAGGAAVQGPRGGRRTCDHDWVGDRVVPRRTRHRPARHGRVRSSGDPSAPGKRSRGERRGARRARAAPRRRARRRGRRDRARLLPGLGGSGRSGAPLRSPARAGRRPRQARGDPQPECELGRARRARRVRRDGHPPLLFVAGPSRGCPRAWVLRLVCRQRHVRQGRGAARGGSASPLGANPGRDRQPLPRAGPAARPAERARQHRPHGRGDRGRAGRGPRGAGGSNRRQRHRGLLPARRLARGVSVRARKELGQHFLVDENILGVIGRLAELAGDDVVLEIGPGLGVLTVFLADRVSSVHAIELDRTLELGLREALAGRENVQLQLGDALALDLATLEPTPNKLVANLPYNVATPLVAESLDRLPGLDLWCVMVQREVADRFFAEPGTKAYGAVSVLVQLVAERTGFHPVSRNVFRPRPNVDSALVAFRRRGELPREYAWVKTVVGAGLGGGSSDAATALRLANATLEEPLEPDRLRGLAVELGSDAPFFLTQGPQLGEGDGTVLTPLDLPQDYWVLLVRPTGVDKTSTADVYGAFDGRDGGKGYRNRRAALRRALKEIRRPRDLARLPPNDLASSPLADDLVAEGAFRADVTGAGPLVYGLFQHLETARAARSALKSRGRVWLTVPTWYG